MTDRAQTPAPNRAETRKYPPNRGEPKYATAPVREDRPRALQRTRPWRTRYAGDPAVQFLLSWGELQEEAELRLACVAALECECARTTRELGDTPIGTQDEHRHEKVWAQLADARAKAKVAVEQAREQQSRVEAAIAAVQNPMARHLLCLRYFEGLRWSDIWPMLGCSESKCHRLHLAALKQIREEYCDEKSEH